MSPESFEWKSGQIMLWDLGDLDPERPLDQQLSELKEDLAQVHYRRNTTLDIGWYPEFSPSGTFIVMVIQDADWDEPIYRAEAKTVSALRLVVANAVQIAEDASIRHV